MTPLRPVPTRTGLSVFLHELHVAPGPSRPVVMRRPFEDLPAPLCLHDGIAEAVVSRIGRGLWTACCDANAAVQVSEDEPRSCEAVLYGLFLHRSGWLVDPTDRRTPMGSRRDRRRRREETSRQRGQKRPFSATPQTGQKPGEIPELLYHC